MNLSLIPTSNGSATRKPGALAKVYTKNGGFIRVPLRAEPSAAGATCSQQPERQFMRWFSRLSAANPDFPVMVESILLVSDQTLCSNCQRILTSFLYRYNLTEKLRLGTLQASTHADSQRASLMRKGEFDPETDQEFSRFRRVRPIGRPLIAPLGRVGRLKSPVFLPSRRSVVHILRRPFLTGYQANLVGLDTVPGTEPALTCNCAHTATEGTEFDSQNPDGTLLDELVGEAALSDEGLFRRASDWIKKKRAEKALIEALNGKPSVGPNPYDANPGTGKPVITAPATNPANSQTPIPRGPYR